MGLFDPGLNPLAWFDESLVIEGWFDSDLIPPDPLPVVSAFLAIKPPDYGHPQHDHDDPVAAGTVDFLALAVVVVATLRRLGIRRS